MESGGQPVCFTSAIEGGGKGIPAQRKTHSTKRALHHTLKTKAGQCVEKVKFSPGYSKKRGKGEGWHWLRPLNPKKKEKKNKTKSNLTKTPGWMRRGKNAPPPEGEKDGIGVVPREKRDRAAQRKMDFTWSTGKSNR